MLASIAVGTHIPLSDDGYIAIAEGTLAGVGVFDKLRALPARIIVAAHCVNGGVCAEL